ncbi:MAG: histidinol-phosphatase [Paracoccus sp. (in: a-proteobacteria)]|uniref:histidinol-phosphatase n=1 Tax=Paracoccus sp. TaxID=267 RepID=UPI0026E0B8EF|nr:histidinol-phosphatase [Paracoccus sp. (in: a-proteobacteria)]MDO5613070.1 histidinol-phosphatase [Paracoccus sp. (in: a-proteobacteria)]
MPQHDHRAIIDTAHALADQAAQAILPLFRSPLTAENKLAGGFDPVTAADRASEQAMRAILAERRPDDAILGEEFGAQPGRSGLTWVLDPIDGTRAFICGAPTWGVLIGLRDETGPLYGVIDQPYTGERFEGGLGLARMTGPRGETALAVRQTTDLAQATLMSTYPEVGSPAEAAAFHRVAGQVRLTRYGMDCYAYALLALGHVDLVIEAGLQAYDVVAPIAVVRAAGGIVTDWQGGDPSGGGQIIAAATPELHRAALALLNQTA